MQKILLIFLVSVFCFSVGGGPFGSSSVFCYAEDIAVIVNKHNPMENISFREMEKVFWRERKFWPDKSRIYFVLPQSGSREKKVLMRRVYKMGEMDLRKIWLTKIFRGEIVGFPKVLNSSASIKRFVARVPNAIGVVCYDEIDAQADEGIKVLRVEGRLPEEKGYPLGPKEGNRNEDKG
ncbi:MAG: hypothetical protein ACE5GG_03495 [Candidatus Omnitrophota bacterium]